MYMDDLPIWGIVGEQGEDGKDFFIWTHKKFEVGFNGNQIVDVNLTSEVKVRFSSSRSIIRSKNVIMKRELCKDFEKKRHD